MNYDPTLRRNTALAEKLKAQIRAGGPITVATYMQSCLQDAEHGYYRCRPAIGTSGDFVTSPEISQVFGELLGLWSVVVWQQMGAPAAVNLVELGPGRGTLMRDALRAARVAPAFLQAVRLHLVESNGLLRTAQADALRGSGTEPLWHDDLSLLAAACKRAPRIDRAPPTILLANEFLDAVPGDQFVRVAPGGWSRRQVGLSEAGELEFRASGALSADPPSLDAGNLAEARHGDIWERQDFDAISTALGELQTTAPLAALLIDYGHPETALGETLQAVRGHTFEHPLTSPGEADLSMQVDFAALGRALASPTGAPPPPRLQGPIPQAEFLGALGLTHRASRLMAANPRRAAEIEAGVARLMSPGGMGGRFKVVGARSAGLPPLPGFPDVDESPAPA